MVKATKSKAIINSSTILFLILLLAGCVTKIDHGYVFDQMTKIRLGEITSDAKITEVDPQKMLRAEMVEALSKEHIFWDNDAKLSPFTLSLHISDYQMGNAFKRWLFPSYGSTVLKVNGELFDPEGEKVTDFSHARSIDAGGLYTVGGWSSIFSAVAKDIAVDLRTRMSGDPSGFFVKLDPWLAHEANIEKSSQSKNIFLSHTIDSRTDKKRIGERHAAFNVSMGNIYMNRNVPDYIEEALRNELLASGNQLTNDEASIQLLCELIKFWVWTDTTALFWDIKSEIIVRLKAYDPATKKTLGTGEYSAQGAERTYVFPGKGLVEKVLNQAMQGLMYEIRKDHVWDKGT